MAFTLLPPSCVTLGDSVQRFPLCTEDSGLKALLCRILIRIQDLATVWLWWLNGLSVVPWNERSWV